MPSVTTEQMIEVDHVAMKETEPNLFKMMENAGRNLALQAIDCLGTGWQKANIIVLAGSGGNGGGGICAAKLRKFQAWCISGFLAAQKLLKNLNNAELS